MSERKASMGDKVYRGDVIKFIRNNISLGTFMKRTVKTANEACWDLCDKLNYVPAIEDKNEPHWISVKERNPIEYDNPTEFLVTLEDPNKERYIDLLMWDGYEWDEIYTDDNELGIWGQDKVIAWMPLPEPYKEVTT